MSRVRTLVAGGVIGAALGVVLAPRHGESRREALDRLWLAARPGRGAVGAFAGTPCAAQRRARVHAGAPDGAGAGQAPTRGGDADG